ncbi:MAG: NUDIX domain-containing protein [Candidatus Woesearchaeota archaeon]|jgi:8-oxo-dGTP pyrophosphatase MutT (NUDIX family)
MIEHFDGVIGIIFQKTTPVKYALIYNKNTKNVTFPAGGKETEENSSLQTLERELKEETGLQPTDYNIIKTNIVHEFVYGSNKKERAGQIAKQIVYLIETTKTTLIPEDPDSVFDGWYTSKGVNRKLTFSDSKELFEKARKYMLCKY